MTPVTPAQIAWQQAAGEGNYYAAYFQFGTTYEVQYDNSNNNRKVDTFNNSTSQAWLKTYIVRIRENNLPLPLDVYYTIVNDMKLGKATYVLMLTEGCGIRECVSVRGHEMPRGVRFGGDAEGDEEAGKVAQAGGKFTRISLVVDEDEGIPNSQNLSRIFNKSHFDAAERELQREQQLKALGEELFGGLVAFSCVIFILCLIMLAMYIHLQPVAPDFEVTGAGFVSLAITALTPAQIAEQTSSGSGNYFAAYFTFNASYTILFTNSNKKVDMFVESIELTVFYNGFRPCYERHYVNNWDAKISSV
ncbi:hypothetical protein SELMODRAFT_418106 [Selaginella moellendorffii]|uniref:Uncharacterized protein n=1 Tax=Selaginella moellendorffii TaxID=88036 RepID=D8S4P6_SELML|nr:hypothetical protein SELMODRAFT_418106 [Selaginella moellendorffii]